MRHLPSVRSLAGAAALLLLASPLAAQRGASRTDLLLSERPAPRRGCSIEMHPLPALGQVADTAALFGALTEFGRENRLATPEFFALYSVGFDRDGRVERLEAIDWYLPKDSEPGLRGIVRAALRSPGKAANLRVRVVPTVEPKVLVGHAEICPPLGLTRVSLEAPQTASRSIPPQLRARVMVSSQGVPQGASLLRGTGDRSLDDWVIENLNRGRYSPGLIDGHPVAMEYEQVVTFRGSNYNRAAGSPMN